MRVGQETLQFIMRHGGDDFPHLCPGLGCAIERWQFQKALRQQFESLGNATHEDTKEAVSGLPGGRQRYERHAGNT